MQEIYILQFREFYGPDLVLHVTEVLYISYTIMYWAWKWLL